MILGEDFLKHCPSKVPKYEIVDIHSTVFLAQKKNFNFYAFHCKFSEKFINFLGNCDMFRHISPLLKDLNFRFRSETSELRRFTK